MYHIKTEKIFHKLSVILAILFNSPYTCISMYVCFREANLKETIAFLCISGKQSVFLTINTASSCVFVCERGLFLTCWLKVIPYLIYSLFYQKVISLFTEDIPWLSNVELSRHSLLTSCKGIRAIRMKLFIWFKSYPKSNK